MATPTKRRGEVKPGNVFIRFRADRETRDLCCRLARARGLNVSEWFREFISQEYAKYLSGDKAA